MPWDFLKQAADRSAAVAIVLDRTPPAAVAEVSSHLARMLTARGLQDSPLFTVRESTARRATGCSPPPTWPRSKDWLGALGADAEARNGVVRQTLEGAIRSLAAKSHQVADAAQEQVDMQARLCATSTGLRPRGPRRSTRRSADGTLLRGEVLARWQEFVGTGELLRGLESKVSWLRDRISNAVKGKPQQAGRVTVAVESGLQTLILENAEAAAERADAAWQSLAAGRPGARRGRARTCPAPRATSAPAAERMPCATGSRACSTWSATKAATSAPPPGSWRTASTGSRSR